uniref:Uncharacterized protein n=1 Tax=Rhizophora mucronata TaxID=61149 RepID=A0A2P2IYS7_RHIMU
MAALVTIALDVIDVFVYVADSLRIIQHVEKIQVPSPLKLLDLKPPEEILWDEKQFGVSAHLAALSLSLVEIG